MNGGKDPATDPPAAKAERFYRLLDALEDQLDSGFFLSFIGKIVVDEKAICSIINELRAMRFDPETPGAQEVSGRELSPAAGVGPGREADSIKGDADRYALETLDNLEQTLQKIMSTVREGKGFLRKRLAQEVTEDGAAEI